MSEKFCCIDFNMPIEQEFKSKTSIIIDKLKKLKINENINNDKGILSDIDWYIIFL